MAAIPLHATVAMRVHTNLRWRLAEFEAAYTPRASADLLAVRAGGREHPLPLCCIDCHGLVHQHMLAAHQSSCTRVVEFGISTE